MSHGHHDHNHHQIDPISATTDNNIGTGTTTTLIGSTIMPVPAAVELELEPMNHEIGHHHHHDNTNGGGGGHQTVFHGGCEEVILFSFWKIQSFFGLFMSFIIIFLIGALYEGIKWFRVYFQLWTTDSVKISACLSMNSVSKGKHHGVEDALIEKTTGQTPSCHSGCGELTPGNTNTITLNQEVYAPTVVVQSPTSVGGQINRWTWLMMYVNREFSPATCRLIETTLYGLQILIAYFLMLIAMTFNTWLTCAVVLGAAFGHWMFANIKCAPPRRCFCSACCNGNGGPEQQDNFATDACH